MKPCKEWTGYRNKKGYGETTGGRVHRLEWAKYFGPVPEGMVVMHTCDNPPCYEITHLKLGTHQDNIRDAVQKGRHSSCHQSGDKNPNVVMSDEEAKEAFRMRVEENYTYAMLASIFGMSNTAMYMRLKRMGS